MRLIRFGNRYEEKPGLLTKDNKLIDLRQIFPDIPDIGQTFFENNWLDRIAGVDSPAMAMDVRIGCPIASPSKIICLGKNYYGHAKETGFDVPKSPLLFSKSNNALNGPYDPILLPASSQHIDWEAELALVIGKQGKRIKKENAFEHIFGYTILNDVSGRDAQFADSQWFRGKSFDTFAPIGPCIISKDEISDIGNLTIQSIVNGQVMQDSNTGKLIFDIPFLIENISQDITLFPGDIISTGTPEGVGYFRDPKIILKSGDVVECIIDEIGSIKNPVQAQ